MSDKYAYLFPYELIPRGARIIIYGAGDVGQEYLQQMQMTGYCEVIAFIDRAYEKYPSMIIPVYPIEKVNNLSFDYVVLAFKMGFHVRAVIKDLISYGIGKNKIIYIEPRQEINIVLAKSQSGDERRYKFSYLQDSISVALKYGPGLGDAIIKKKFFTELINMEPNCSVDIYSPGAGWAIKAIYSDQQNLNEIIDDGGALYREQQKKYDVAITVDFILKIDGLKTERLKQLSSTFAEKMIALQMNIRKYNLSNIGVMQRYIHYNRMKYLGLDYYTYLNSTGVFNIDNHHVSIPLDLNYEKLYHQCKIPKRYITINYGGGVDASSVNNKIAKDWPACHLERFVKLFKNKYTGVSVVQLGAAGTLQIKNVDAYFLGENLELVKYILRGSMLHIDKEGGLVHLATQLGTKCIVCFGPTQVEYFGYDENINIMAGNCHGCHCLYDGFDVCARGMERPECMWSITPEMVMDKVETLKDFENKSI
jgi:ADP-heptose:LPS heptosyltransferase